MFADVLVRILNVYNPLLYNSTNHITNPATCPEVAQVGLDWQELAYGDLCVDGADDGRWQRGVDDVVVACEEGVLWVRRCESL